ncbi:MAG: hypothetical protein IJS67_03265, partial [Clostridia bacterium]|nr:hypothetical protein [Clostridia bacterium]
MDNGAYTEESLKKISIHDLRVIMRSVGGTPSTLNKKQLIEEILKIQKSAVLPSRNARGRKALDLTRSQYADVAFGNAVNFIDDKGDVGENTLTLHDGTGRGKASGIVEIMPDGYGFLCSRKGFKRGNVFVGKALISKYRIKSGDYIVGNVEISPAGNSYTLTEVIGAEDASAGILSMRKDFSSEIAIYPDERISLSALGDEGRLIDLLCPAGKGERMLLTGATDPSEFAVKLSAALYAEGVYPVTLLVDCLPEDYGYMIGNASGEVVCSTFDEDDEERVRAVSLAVDRVHRLAECGRDSALVICSMEAVMSSYQVGRDAKMKKIFASFKNTENKGAALFA